MKNFGLLLLLSLFLFSCNKKTAPLPKGSVKNQIKAEFISDADFTSQVLEKEGLIVVDFWASWCGPCRTMDPVINNFANEYPTVKFVKIDTDRNPLIKEEYAVWGLPTIMFFKNGKEISRQVGMTTEGTLRNKIERWK